MATEAKFRAALAAMRANDLAEELAVLWPRERMRLDADHWPGADKSCADSLSRLPLQVALPRPLPPLVEGEASACD